MKNWATEFKRPTQAFDPEICRHATKAIYNIKRNEGRKMNE